MNDAADRQAFESMLAADPYDTTTRLVYSDWLDERCLDAEAAEHRRMATPEWCAARKWLWAYAIRMNPYEIEEYSYDHASGETICTQVPDGEQKAFDLLMQGLRDKYLYAHGTDLHGLYELDDGDELRQQANVYLGVEDDWSNFEFTCSC